MAGEWPGTGDNPWLDCDPGDRRDDLRLGPTQADYERQEDEDERHEDDEMDYGKAAGVFGEVVEGQPPGTPGRLR